MNDRQKTVLIIAAIIVIGMLVFPPYHFHSPLGDVSQGYHFIFEKHSYENFIGKVDVVTLMTQWLGVLIAGGIAFLVTRSK